MPLRQQMKSPEFFALGLFFSLNVLVLQFYLGTARVQLEEMSTDYKRYVQILSFIVPGMLQLLMSVCIAWMLLYRTVLFITQCHHCQLHRSFRVIKAEEKRSVAACRNMCPGTFQWLHS